MYDDHFLVLTIDEEFDLRKQLETDESLIVRSNEGGSEMRVHNGHAAPTPRFGTEPSEGDICACRMTRGNKTLYVAFRKGSWLEQDPVDLYQAYGVVRMECSVYQDIDDLVKKN